MTIQYAANLKYKYAVTDFYDYKTIYKAKTHALTHCVIRTAHTLHIWLQFLELIHYQMQLCHIVIGVLQQIQHFALFLLLKHNGTTASYASSCQRSICIICQRFDIALKQFYVRLIHCRFMFGGEHFFFKHCHYIVNFDKLQWFSVILEFYVVYVIHWFNSYFLLILYDLLL